MDCFARGDSVVLDVDDGRKWIGTPDEADQLAADLMCVAKRARENNFTLMSIRKSGAVGFVGGLIRALTRSDIILENVEATDYGKRIKVAFRRFGTDKEIEVEASSDETVAAFIARMRTA